MVKPQPATYVADHCQAEWHLHPDEEAGSQTRERARAAPLPGSSTLLALVMQTAFGVYCLAIAREYCICGAMIRQALHMSQESPFPIDWTEQRALLGYSVYVWQINLGSLLAVLFVAFVGFYFSSPFLPFLVRE